MKNLKRLFRYDWPLHTILVLTNWLPDNVFFIRLRGKLASPFFKKCGKKLGIGRNVTFYDPSKIEIGNWVYIAYGCWFSASGGIKIADEVLIGPYCIFVTSNHTRLNGSFRYGESLLFETKIGHGTWIGAHSCVLAGVTIGEGSAIACNSTVLKDCESSALYAGNPAMIKKKYDEE